MVHSKENLQLTKTVDWRKRKIDRERELSVVEFAYSTRHRTIAGIVVATAALVLICSFACIQIQHIAHSEGLRLWHVLMWRLRRTRYVRAIRWGIRIKEAVQVVGDP